MLRVDAVSKSYGDRLVVDRVSLDVRAGECVGLLGPNGAGKTTTVSLIAGLLRPDAGAVTFDGTPLTGDRDPARRHIGLVPQELAIYEELTPRNNLRLMAGLYGLSGSAAETAIRDALDTVGLVDRADAPARRLSGGMQRRLNLAAGLIGQPRLLILDEPTVGVDPESRLAVFANLERLKHRGVGFLYTTHYMEEVERLCDRVVIIDCGRVIAAGTLNELYDLVPSRSALRVGLQQTPAEPERLLAGLRGISGVTAASLTDARLNVGLASLAIAPRVLEWLNASGAAVAHFGSDRASLETVYLTLTGGKSLVDAA